MGVDKGVFFITGQVLVSFGSAVLGGIAGAAVVRSPDEIALLDTTLAMIFFIGMICLGAVMLYIGNRL
jgi:hypothetical protein